VWSHNRLPPVNIFEVSSLLNILQSTVSGIITKWKQLRTTATQPQSGRPRNHKARFAHAEAEAHSEEKLPTFYRVNSYRPPNFIWLSD